MLMDKVLGLFYLGHELYFSFTVELHVCLNCELKLHNIITYQGNLLLFFMYSNSHAYISIAMSF